MLLRCSLHRRHSGHRLLPVLLCRLLLWRLQLWHPWLWVPLLLLLLLLLLPVLLGQLLHHWSWRLLMHVPQLWWCIASLPLGCCCSGDVGGRRPHRCIHDCLRGCKLLQRPRLRLPLRWPLLRGQRLLRVLLLLMVS